MHKWDTDIKQASSVLLKGGIILYPTDTIWGIGCLATIRTAVSKIYQIKQREDSKSMLILVNSLKMLRKYVGKVPDIAIELIHKYPKAVTLIYPNAKNVADNLLAPDHSIGIRLVNDDFCTALIQKVDNPIVSTSANISGTVTPSIFSEINEKIKGKVDYIVEWEQDNDTKKQPSDIIKLLPKGDYQIIRK